MTSDSVAGAVERTRRWPLDLTRVVSVIGVVAIHVFAGMVGNPEIRSGTGWWAAVVADIGFVWVVPVFVMISGALVLEPRQYAAGSVSFYRKRLLRLAPALVFWSLFYFIVIRTGVSQAPVTRVGLVSFVLDGRPYTHLYFLWLIVGLYAVAPVLAAFLRDGGKHRALIFAGVVLAATVITGSSSSLLGMLGSERPLTLMALTQWVPYVGFFLAGWALRDVVLRGWALAAAVAGTFIALVIPIIQYGVRPAWSLLDAIAPVSYFGPFVAAASIGVFVCANSLLAGWRPGIGAGKVLRELSDSAFGVFLVHFALMVFLRGVAPFSGATMSFALSALLWIVVVILSFIIVIGMRRVPFLRRLV
ncbi:acyltransferase [Microbacterium sp. A84]|uniref:acyltransferase n=1 Tax=Microbacterium sp. A84 TaxID=3450715 RepID=UPI003F42268A